MGYYPGRFLVGTARRFAYSVKKANVGPQTETGWSRFVDYIIDSAEKRNKEKRARKQLAEKHRVSFTD
jgi:hypothetical protein